MTDTNWWTPEYEFFGQFYEFADRSEEGFNTLHRMTREERTQREIAIIEKFLSPTPKSKILDCPCGSGRHSLNLAQKGYQVVGIDINDYMLKLANGNRQNASLNGNITFMKMDMRKLELENESFDYIINMFLSFGFFNDIDNIKVVKEFSRLLKRGGKLLLHLDLNYDRVINNLYLRGDQHISRGCNLNGEYRILEIKEKYDEQNKRLLGEWTLLNGGPITKNYSLRVYDNEKEFIPMFKENGFSKVTLYDPDKNEFDIESKETILVAIK